MRELGLEYLETAQTLRARIDDLKAQKETAKGEEYFSVLRRIDAAKEEYYHARTVGRHLLEYYRN